MKETTESDKAVMFAEKFEETYDEALFDQIGRITQ